MNVSKIPYVKFLTRDQINAIPVQECGESMLDIPVTDNISLRQDSKFLIPKMRKSALEKVIEASKNLPNGYSFRVMSAYISVSIQREIWNRKYAKVKKSNSGLPEAELEKLTRRYVAYPVVGAPHNTGGAIDVIILDENDRELDMGSKFAEAGLKAHTRYDDLTDEQRSNRELLYWTMTNAGLLNTNPFEWWHYAYGDRAWAGYAKKPFAIYDGIED